MLGWSWLGSRSAKKGRVDLFTGQRPDVGAFVLAAVMGNAAERREAVRHTRGAGQQLHQLTGEVGGERLELAAVSAGASIGSAGRVAGAAGEPDQQDESAFAEAPAAWARRASPSVRPSAESAPAWITPRRGSLVKLSQARRIDLLLMAFCDTEERAAARNASASQHAGIRQAWEADQGAAESSARHGHP